MHLADCAPPALLSAPVYLIGVQKKGVQQGRETEDRDERKVTERDKGGFSEKGPLGAKAGGNPFST